MAQKKDGRLQMDIYTDLSTGTAGASFELWFDNSDFVAEMEQMKKEMAIWDIDWPVAIRDMTPDKR
jgi:hypothetical protein